MWLSEPEGVALRDYLLPGGVLIATRNLQTRVSLWVVRDEVRESEERQAN